MENKTVTLQLKKNCFDALQWKDNLHEMKTFCMDNCTITYETCHIDDYWSLKVLNGITGKEVAVALYDWVIKIDDNFFIVVSNDACKEMFDRVTQSDNGQDAEKSEGDETGCDCEFKIDWPKFL